MVQNWECKIIAEHTFVLEKSTKLKSKNKGKIAVINFRCWTVILGVSTISSCMTTACSFWIWSVAQSLLLKLKSSAERVKGRALVVSGVRGNRNPRVLGTFAPKVPPPRTAEKKYIITFIYVWYKDKFEFIVLLFYIYKICNPSLYGDFFLRRKLVLFGRVRRPSPTIILT